LSPRGLPIGQGENGTKFGVFANLSLISPGIVGSRNIIAPRLQSTAIETLSFAETMTILLLVPSPIAFDGNDLQLPSIPGVDQAIIPLSSGTNFDRPAFDELVGIETGLFLPNIVTTHSLVPSQLKFDHAIKPLHNDRTLSSLGYCDLQTIIPTLKFTKPVTASLSNAIELNELCHCFDDGQIACFLGSGLIDIDFTAETAQIREINLEDGQQHSLQGNVNFRISNEINSFEDDDTQIWLRLNKEVGQEWVAQ
jgi:hypothetical protein